MKVNRIITAIVLVVLFIAGCKKAEQFSVIPAIRFKSLSTDKDATGYDTKVHVVVSFTDGDGDIGYGQLGENGSPYDDSTSQYFNNFIVKLFEKRNGVWIANPVKLDGRMPYLTPDGNNKALKGDIAMDLPVSLAIVKDTIRYDVFIYDRALHQSNTVTTSEIIITTH